MPSVRRTDDDDLVSTVLTKVVFGVSGVLLITSVGLTNVTMTFPINIKLTLTLNIVAACVNGPRNSLLVLFLNIIYIIVTVVFATVTCNHIARRTSGSHHGGNLVATVLTNVVVK